MCYPSLVVRRSVGVGGMIIDRLSKGGMGPKSLRTPGMEASEECGNRLQDKINITPQDRLSLVPNRVFIDKSIP